MFQDIWHVYFYMKTISYSARSEKLNFNLLLQANAMSPLNPQHLSDLELVRNFIILPRRVSDVASSQEQIVE